MLSPWKITVPASLLALAAGVLLGMNLFQPALGTAQQFPAGRPARYSVVHTEGTNLIVTDNKTNTVYYYTTDQGAEPGSDLKLRGSLDLRQVGQPVLKAKLVQK